MNQKSISDLRPILGTANLGTQYGLNSALSPEAERATQILNYAIGEGITAIDTAEGYAESHSYIRGVVDRIKTIDTKIFLSGRSPGEMEIELERQLRLFGESKVRRVLAHDWYKASLREKRQFVSLCRQYPNIKFGASLYAPNEFYEILSDFNELKVFQVPLNMLDQRFLTIILNTQFMSDFNFVTRSIFLQGALDWENKFNPFRNNPSVSKIRSFAAERCLDLTYLVITFLKTCNVREFVFGTTSEEQINKIFNSIVLATSAIDFSPFASADLSLIDPRKWGI